MFGLFRRQSSFGRENSGLARSAQPRRVSLQVEELEPRVVPATDTVMNLMDGAGMGPAGSLRNTLANAAAGDTIVFQSGLSGPLTLTNGQLALTKSVNIQGPGAGVITISGNNASRIFFSNTAALNINISGLTLTGGKPPSANFPASNGGAIEENGDNLTLTACTLTGNTAANAVGGAQKGGGGALYAQNGTLTVSGCTITNNFARLRRGGGIYALNCPATIQNCTITGNDSFTGSPDAGGGGGLFLKGTGVKTITGCNISMNTANYGAGVYFKNTPAGSVMQNCTLTGNTAKFNAGGNPKSGGGAAVLLYNGILTIENCTISGNTAPNTAGGGIKVKNDSYDAPPVLTATLTLVSTIVSGNSDASGPNDIARYNNALVTINASNDLFQTAPAAGVINGINSANVTGVNPMLGAPQNNGGPTFTEALPASSPAIDKGSNPGNLATDQRGPGFARTSGAGTDIGAFELQFPPTITSINPSSGPTTGGTTVTIAGMNFNGVTAVLFGTTAATSFTVNSMTSITATSPAGTGTVDVTVTADGGTSATSAADQFTFTTTPPPMPPPTPPTPPPPPPLMMTQPPPFVSVAFTSNGQATDVVTIAGTQQVVELVSSTGVLTQFDVTGAHQLATGVRSASAAFGAAGEVLVVVFQNGQLFQFDAAGTHLFASGVLSANVAFTLDGTQEVLEVVFADGTLVQFDAAGAHQLASGVRTASVAFGVPGEVLDLVFADGRLLQFDASGAHQLATGVVGAGVALSPAGQEVLDVIFADGSLFQYDASGSHLLAASV